MLGSMSRSFASCLLCALLTWGGVPFGAAAGAQRAACRMACCTRGTPSSAATTATLTMHPAPSRAAAPQAPPPLCCSCGSGQVPQQAGVPGGNPSVLPDPPRLPAPLAASLVGRQSGQPLERLCLDLPERPPRA
jgi:hypothetical protein